MWTRTGVMVVTAAVAAMTLGCPTARSFSR